MCMLSEKVGYAQGRESISALSMLDGIAIDFRYLIRSVLFSSTAF